MAVDDELERFKSEVNLTEYAASLGYQLVDRARSNAVRTGGSTASSIAMRHPATDDKVIIRKDGDGHWTYFSVRDDRDNGTIVDFLQRRRALSLGSIRKELREWLRVDRPRMPPSTFRGTVAPQSRDLDRAARDYGLAHLDPRPRYLLGRGLRPETLDALCFRDCFRVDRRGTIFFPHRHPEDATRVAGFEKKAEGFTGFSTGGMKTYWSSAFNTDDVRLVLVEGAIDALSYHQLNPEGRTRYWSTGGAVGADQLAIIRRELAALPRKCALIDATDNDAGGEKLRTQVQAVAEGRALLRHAPPIGKDWNDTLKQVERDYIKTLDVRRERRLER
jgi:hypothetical protein